MPLVPILLAIGGVTLAASLFAPWFEVASVGISGFEDPPPETVARVEDDLRQDGWAAWGGADVAFFVLGAGLALLAAYDAVRHRVPHTVLAAAALLCAAALGVLLAGGFQGDAVTLVEGSLGEGTGEARIERERGGGQWVALIGLGVALAGLGLGHRERRLSP